MYYSSTQIFFLKSRGMQQSVQIYLTEVSSIQYYHKIRVPFIIVVMIDSTY